MTDVKKILFEICESDEVYKEDVDLVESGLLDSFAIIELFSRLEDEGISIPITRVDRSKLSTVKGIEDLIEEYSN